MKEETWRSYSVSAPGPGFFMSSTSFSAAPFSAKGQAAAALVEDISGSLHWRYPPGSTRTSLTYGL